MPYALHMISPPGSLVAGYQRGHEIHPSVIEAWGLVEGDDWAAEHPDARAEAPAVARPADDTDRGAWVAYAVSRGMDPEEAANTDLTDLMDAYPEEGTEAEPVTPTERPSESARKSEWVIYVNNHPQARDEDRVWAGDDSTTKAELMAWEPVGYPAAVAATEQANG